CAIVAVLTRWPPRFQQTSEAARFLALSARTLEKHHCYGTGPKYRKLGGRVIYALADLKAWAGLGIKASTSRRPIQVLGLYCRLSQFSRPDGLARRRAPMVGKKTDRHRTS